MKPAKIKVHLDRAMRDAAKSRERLAQFESQLSEAKAAMEQAKETYRAAKKEQKAKKRAWKVLSRKCGEAFAEARQKGKELTRWERKAAKRQKSAEAPKKDKG